MTVTGFASLRQPSRLLALAALLAAVGCGHNAEVILRQTFAPPSQQVIKLESDQAFFLQEDGSLRWLIGFQRPGSDHGPNDYYLYGVMPDENVAYVSDSGGEGLRGFLTQEVGELHGNAEFDAGRAWCKHVLLRSNVAKLELRLRCADGSEIVGHARIRRNVRALHAFERQNAAELEQLGGALGSSRRLP